jgi:hypothetical protein
MSTIISVVASGTLSTPAKQRALQADLSKATIASFTQPLLAKFGKRISFLRKKKAEQKKPSLSGENRRAIKIAALKAELENQSNPSDESPQQLAPKIMTGPAPSISPVKGRELIHALRVDLDNKVAKLPKQAQLRIGCDIALIETGVLPSMREFRWAIRHAASQSDDPDLKRHAKVLSRDYIASKDFSKYYEEEMKKLPPHHSEKIDQIIKSTFLSSKEFAPDETRIYESIFEELPPFQVREYSDAFAEILFTMNRGACRECRGRSMMPTLPESCSSFQIPIVDASRVNLQRGDLVSFVLRLNPGFISTFAMKRIHALEGDVVEMIDRKRYIVPRGCCWVLGDNAADSLDSRYFGAVPLSNIRGKMIMSFHDDPHHFAYHLREDSGNTNSPE